MYLYFNLVITDNDQIMYETKLVTGFILCNFNYVKLSFIYIIVFMNKM